MCPNLTEEEMRRALFGTARAAPSPASAKEQNETLPPAAPSPSKPIAKRKSSGSGIPKVVVTLPVGNEFEGKMELFVYEAHTLSTLQAELDATKAARKKFRYIELVSIKPAG
ncbi:hypothetical protein [Pseudomonas sp. RGM 3321]|uniref:hypothetical protein n=1 Tax=Pseudomonas sp. RGM 3321 TaxID=2930089 RepID=UPI001FCB42DA|nr:hypothetical protein [Pseudomonas sp. RGM 3321]MCJ2374044.1 hypothetical protein [Pseudomonas sp. RGM 3321]